MKKYLQNILRNSLSRTRYKLLGKENSSGKYCVKLQGFFMIFHKNQQNPGLSRTLFKFQDLWET